MCEQDWFTRGHAAKRAVSLIRKLAQSPFFASSAPVPATGRWLGSPVRRSPMRGALVGDCSVVASAPLTPVAPTMDARFGTPVLMPIPRIAHLSSTSIVEEAAVGPSSSPESSTPLRQVGVTLISFLTGSPASGAEGTIVHITQGRHAHPPVSGATQCCRGQMAIEGTACPHARTTTTHRLARRRSGRLQLPMAGRDPNSPGTVIFVPTFPLALSKSPISRNGFGPLPRRDGPNAVELSDALLASVHWAWWRGVQSQHGCPEHPPTCSPLHKNREGNWH